MCENLFTEDEVEQAADEGFDCAACQPFIVKPLRTYLVLQIFAACVCLVQHCMLVGKNEYFVDLNSVFVHISVAPVILPPSPVKFKEPGKCLQMFNYM